MNNKKIALLTIDYPPRKGGVARYLGNLVSVSNGAIDVFVPNDLDSKGPGRVQKIAFGNRFRLSKAVPFIGSLKSKDYDLVLVSHVLPVGTAAYLSRLLGGPRYAVLCHGLDIRLASRSTRKRWLARRILRRAEFVIANSEFTAHEINMLEPRLKKMLVLTPGVESITFPDRLAARKRLGIGNDDLIILSVCRLVKRKGIDLLIETLPHLPENVRLVVIGDGPDRPRLEAIVKNTGRAVLFLTDVSDEDRNQWYAAADLFSLPARDEHGDVEGFGIVYLEAALAGLPVVAGKSGGVSEAVLDGKTGILIDPDNEDALKEALLSLIRDPHLRSTLGKNGRERVRRDFQWPDRFERLRNALL
ncbi:MAG TPA: glycosyltransferase family 4 protein [Patescibacteria group bacterium]|nr:glycosyltransferase family 4 protein [Patescibacteria group bacterium]